MSRIFWDTMLFVYLLENNPKFESRVGELLTRSYTRADTLLTSDLAVGEVMVGAKGNRDKANEFRKTIIEMGFSFLPFRSDSVEVFAELRSIHRLKAPDAIHLACASTHGVDMFLTNDENILKRRLHLPGIQFVVDFTLPVL